MGQNRDHVKDALQRAREELRGRRSLLLQLRLLYSNIERCSRKLDSLKDKQDPLLKEKVMNSIHEILKEGNLGKFGVAIKYLSKLVAIHVQ